MTAEPSPDGCPKSTYSCDRCGWREIKRDEAQAVWRRWRISPRVLCPYCAAIDDRYGIPGERTSARGWDAADCPVEWFR